VPIRMLREFIKLESSAGIILFLTAVLALIVDNTPLHNLYHSLFNLPLTLKLGEFGISKPLLLWVNDGFMAVFFFLVGLEIKREMLEGELNTLSKAALPGVAAVGGMVVPALIYLLINYHDSNALRGWAIPTATDIAFSLGILSLLGQRIPVSLKVFLTALAIFDDLGAIIVIAIFYTQHISVVLLLTALVFILILVILNRFHVTHFAAYILTGIALWVCVLKSGVHATLAGVIVALAIPIRDPKDPEKSPLRDMEHRLHPWVAFGVLPLFAFANAGIDFSSISAHDFFGSIPMGIALGLFIGKQVGIWGASMLAVRCGFAHMPKGASSAGIYGVSLLAGVGFTMSLFIGTLAFGDYTGHYSAQVRVGVIVGSVVAGALGYLILRMFYTKPHQAVLGG